MVLNILSTYVDFKNTKEGKKVEPGRKGDDTPYLRFIKFYSKPNNIPQVRIEISGPLVKEMKENGITRFKLMFDEKSYNVAFVYNTLPNAKDLSKFKLRPRGCIEFMDKYVTATMLPLLDEKNATRLIYKGKFIKEASAYTFTIYKLTKRKK